MKNEMSDGLPPKENLFAYGTLMCEDIMEEVAGCRRPGVPGTLRGYRRRSVRGERYPALIPHRKGCVEGVLYLNITASAWERLDRFEGEMYERQSVRIELHDGKTLAAATYVARPEFLGQLESSDWDYAEFLRSGKADFQNRYAGYAQIHQNGGSHDG